MQYRCRPSCFHKHDVISEALKCLKTYQSLVEAAQESCMGRSTEEADMLQQTNVSDRRWRQAERDDGWQRSIWGAHRRALQPCVRPLCSTPTWHSSHMLKAWWQSDLQWLGNTSQQNGCFLSLSEMFYNPNPKPSYKGGENKCSRRPEQKLNIILLM